MQIGCICEHVLLGIVVVEQIKLLQPLLSTDLKQALISELVGTQGCAEDVDLPQQTTSRFSPKLLSIIFVEELIN